MQHAAMPIDRLGFGQEGRTVFGFLKSQSAFALLRFFIFLSLRRTLTPLCTSFTPTDYVFVRFFDPEIMP